MVQDIASLQGRFEFAHGRLAEILKSLRGLGTSSCVMRADIFRKAARPESHTIVGFNATELKQVGFLSADNSMPEDVQRVVLFAFGYDESSDVPKEALEVGAPCPCFVGDRFHTLERLAAEP